MSRPVVAAALIALLAVAGPAHVTAVSAQIPAARMAAPAAAIMTPAATDPVAPTGGEGAGAPVAYIGQGWG